ncbi:unnamed protein product [Eruca vesicaria subsp. sativa]|uniref:RRM domain-containing protein n=1 Tax=Eruca vesicaria subsp. sativa TaxID=29727 RepID=A0ABC8JE05_ERUVS|nr:unnamed protein product [Eruca vesicaria subsp. sativa]
MTVTEPLAVTKETVPHCQETEVPVTVAHLHRLGLYLFVFERAAREKRVNLVMDKVANRPRRFAFLRYESKEEFMKAIQGMHGKFRLGLRVSSGCCDGMRIREAKTEVFIVKDNRGELYEKHYPPAMNDDVWRLRRLVRMEPSIRS